MKTAKEYYFDQSQEDKEKPTSEIIVEFTLDHFDQAIVELEKTKQQIAKEYLELTKDHEYSEHQDLAVTTVLSGFDQSVQFLKAYKLKIK